MTNQMTWAQRIQQARNARVAAMAAEEQTVRDAVADGTTPTDVAAAYGTKNRQRVYAILRANPAAPQPPMMPAVIYLRGAGCAQSTWDQVEPAMWARGWATTHDRTTAWHLARGGMVVVFCDFSAADAQGLSMETVTVGQVRAKYGTDPFDGGQEMQLPLVNGGEQPRPETYDDDAVNRIGHRGAVVLDVDALARMVAQALGEQP